MPDTISETDESIHFIVSLSTLPINNIFFPIGDLNHEGESH